MFYSFGIISIEGVFIILFIEIIGFIFYFSNNYKINLILEVLNIVLTGLIFICFMIEPNRNIWVELNFFMYIWFVIFFISIINLIQSFIFRRHSNEKISIDLYPPSLFYDPFAIGLILLPNSWYVWLLLLFANNRQQLGKDPSPLFSIKNQNILNDNINKINLRRFHIPISIFFLTFFVLDNWFSKSNSLVTIFLFNGAFIAIFSYGEILKRNFSNTFKRYKSFSLVLGNYRVMDEIATKNGFLNLLKRFNLPDYAILATPYNKLVSNVDIMSKEDLAVNSHHLILLDGGEDSSRIVEMERGLSNFLGRVDTVIDVFDIPGLEIDD
jgi:hypothetical protein